MSVIGINYNFVNEYIDIVIQNAKTTENQVFFRRLVNEIISNSFFLLV
jgi:hypothetical protein